MTTRSEFEAALSLARRYFSEEPWWLENMVRRILRAAEEQKFKDAAASNGEVMAMLDRMYGDVEPVSESLADYVTVEKVWWIREVEADLYIRFFGTHERAFDEVLRLNRDGKHTYTLVEEP